MHPVLELLISLKEIDHQLDLFRAEIEKNEKLIQEKENNIKSLKLSTSSIEKKLKDTLLILKKEEEILKEIEYKIEQKNKEYFAGKITNAKELKAFQREMAHLREEKDEKETDVLLIMEELEKLKAETEKTKEKSKKSIKTWEKEIGELREEIEKTEEKFKNIEEKRQDLIQKIEKKYYNIYEEIKREKPNPIVEVKENICTGCHLVIPEQVITKVMEDDEIIMCPNCGRILYKG